MSEGEPGIIESLSFEDWVSYCFDRKDRHWWSLASNPDADNYAAPSVEIASHMTRLCRESKSVLGKYSDDQISNGIWYCFGVGSGYSTQILDHDRPLALEFYEAIPALYRDTFQTRCSDEFDGRVALDGAVYMIWDMDGVECPLCHKSWPSYLRKAALGTLERILFETANSVCHLSALHGIFESNSTPRSLIDNVIEDDRFSPQVREAAQGILVGQHP